MAPKQFSLASRIKLNNGMSMPRIHLGVYMMNGKEASNSVKWALEAGYRGVDSAQMYHNESETGKAIQSFLSSPEAKSAGVSREDIHYTTKLSMCSDYDRARKSISASVKNSGLGYVDLFLLHSPHGGKQARLDSWRAIEDAIDAGEVRIGGISNFGVRHMQELLDSKPRIKPAVNQIEVHPFNTRTQIAEFAQKNDIVVEAYAPLVRAMRMDHAKIKELSSKYKCTPAQLLVRWSLQHGYVPLPKSATKSRIEENALVGGFEISQEDMAAMDSLDEYLVTDWDPYEVP